MSFDAARVIYRDAQAGDARPLADLARRTFIDTFGALYPPTDLSDFLEATYARHLVAAWIADPSQDIRLACDGGAAIGYCSIGPLKLPIDAGGRAACELQRLYVIEAAKGAGVAATLMEWALERAAARGAQDFYLGVYYANARALAFYRRRGFEIVGRYDFAVGKTIDDERIMRLALR